MGQPFNTVFTGTFTSNGTSQLINVVQDLVKFEVFNETQFGSAAAATPMIRAQWLKDLAAGSAYLDSKTNGAATIQITNMITTNGFTFIDPTTGQLPIVGASVTATAETAANPIVVSTGNTANLVAGQTVVRMLNVTTMQQISGMDFTVGTVVASTSFQLKFLDGSTFAAAGTGGAYRIVSSDFPYYPRRRFITNISQAASARITMSVTHGFTVGQLVRIIVPTGFGMTQMNGLLGQITAINTADASGITNTIDININSSAFSAFSFPTSATAATGVTFAQVVPVGEAASGSGAGSIANLVDDATRNQEAYQMLLGSSVVGGNNDVIRWIATRALILS